MTAPHMAPGRDVAGPAIVAEDETTHAGRARLDAAGWMGCGYLELTQEAALMSSEPAPSRPIQRQIMWNRLIAVVEEQAQTMIRTAFSTTVREAGDLSAGVFDLRGPHAGPGRHRHAGPRELHGGSGRALPREVPGRTR